MTEGDVSLTSLPQVDGRTKRRPVLLLRRLPPYGDWLVCGISTQLSQQVAGFDDLIDRLHSDFGVSGLKAPSLIRLGYLLVVPTRRLFGRIGSVSRDRHAELLRRLADYLRPPNP